MFKFLSLKLAQKLLNRGQLKQFSFNQALFILSETLRDSKKYNQVTKAQWNKFK
jgi:hypothetical protein